MDDIVIIIVLNYSTVLVNSLLFNEESCNNLLESCCIISGVILSTKTLRDLT